MPHQEVVNLGNLLLSLSEALDLGGSAFARHHQKVAYIALEISKAAGLPEKQKELIFTAALLHDIGIVSIEEKLSLMRLEEEDESHSIRGARLLEEVPLLTQTARIVRNHHRGCQEHGEDIDDPDVLASQIILLADTIDCLFRRNRFSLHPGDQIGSRVISEARSRMDGKIHPRVVQIFLSVGGREEFWRDLVSPDLSPFLLHDGPCRDVEIEMDDVLCISTLFGSVIDFRSPSTSMHTAGVAACAEMISSLYGMSASELRGMRVAANLHDLGKLGIPDSILGKPGTLTPEEFAVMKEHPRHTYRIVNAIGGWQDIAEWAAYHHEKIDGSGYPFHCRGEKLSTGARIMAVADIFTILAEDRPFRTRMDPGDLLDTMNLLRSGHLLDADVVTALLDNFETVYRSVREEQLRARELFETRFLMKESAPDWQDRPSVAVQR